MKSVQVLAIIGIVAQLAVATPSEEMYLRGKVVSSEGSQTPLDSVIVRLLAANESVYSTTDGSFILGEGDPVPTDKRPTVISPDRVRIKNCRLYKPGGFSEGARIRLYNLSGVCLQTIDYEKSNVDQQIDLSVSSTTGTGSANYILTITPNGIATPEYHLLTVIDQRIHTMSFSTENINGRSHKSIRQASAPSVDTLHLWKPGFKAKKIAVSDLVDSLDDITLDTLTQMQTAPAPLFNDPLCDGAADPTIIWNRKEKAFWIFYTNRRAGNCCQGCTGVQWVFGTDIGITSTFDGGATWQYRGIAKLTGKEDLNWNDSKNTFWAVEVIYNEEVYHMYASITPGILSSWNERIAGIVHLTATDDPLNGWSYDEIPYKAVHQGIDAGIHKLDDGKWYLWGKFNDVLTSTDLKNWTPAGLSVSRPGEAPYVFHWKNYYWMIWDPTGGTSLSGLTVWRSTDGRSWTTQASILSGEGTRTGDTNADGKHCSVVVQKDRAYIIYFTQTSTAQKSCLQAAPLSVENGVLKADRNTPFEFILEHYDDPDNAGR